MSAPRRTVWFADDSRLERERMRSILASDYTIELFSDGAEVIEWLSRRQAPDLLIVDWVMESVAGPEVVEYARSLPIAQDIGIIVLTGSLELAVVERALAAGADDFLKKPVDAVELHARVARLLVRTGQRERLAAENQRVNTAYATRVASAEHELATERELRREVERIGEAWRRSQERLRLVIDATGVGTWEVNLATQEIEGDERMRELASIAPGEPFTVESSDLHVHPDDRARMAAAMAAALAGAHQGRYQLDHRVIADDGTLRHVEVRGRAFFDASGRAERFVGTARDVTERYLLESARTDLLRALALQPSLQVCVLRGAELRFELVNPLFESLWPGRTLLDRPLEEAIPESIAMGFPHMLRQVLQSRSPQIGREVAVVTPSGDDGRDRDGFFDFVFQPVIGEDGQADTVLIIGREVTDVVAARHAAETLAEQARERADFEQKLIGIVSHDLRTPLHAIGLSASLLARADTSERTQQLAKRIHGSVDRAVRLVHDLLDFTQARLAGRIRITRAPVDLGDTIRTVVDELRAQHPTRTIDIAVQGQTAGFWDPGRIDQVVANLVGNALKYSPEGTPVQVRVRESGDGIELEVHNQGAPIPVELRENIFEPMQRAASDTATRSVGLGLYIVRKIVDAHEGQVWLRPGETEGTTFAVRLPRGTPPAEA